MGRDEPQRGAEIEAHRDSVFFSFSHCRATEGWMWCRRAKSSEEAVIFFGRSRPAGSPMGGGGEETLVTGSTRVVAKLGPWKEEGTKNKRRQMEWGARLRKFR